MKKIGTVMDEMLYRRLTKACEQRGVEIKEAIAGGVRMWLGDLPPTDRKSDAELGLQVIDWMRRDDANHIEQYFANFIVGEVFGGQPRSLKEMLRERDTGGSS